MSSEVEQEGACVLNFINGVQRILKSGDTDRCGPDSCYEAKGQLAPGGGSGGSVATVIRGTEDYKEKKKHLVKYLLMKVVEEDWHGVSDAANDIRVLEAKEEK